MTATDTLVQPVVPTEAEILAMPDEEYMNAQQLEFFRHMLLTMREQMLKNGAATIAHMQVTEATPDEADRASQEEERVLEQRIRDRERKQLHKIDGALDRIVNNTYGYCERSGEPIGLRRLIARPTATLSIEEQEKHEREERLFR